MRWEGASRLVRVTVARRSWGSMGDANGSGQRMSISAVAGVTCAYSMECRGVACIPLLLSCVAEKRKQPGGAVARVKPTVCVL